MGTLVAHSHCVHHQAVDTLGAGLVVTAWCDDVIEGIELPDRWVVGVQWHPEDDADDEPAQQALFDAFVTASREQSAQPRPLGPRGRSPVRTTVCLLLHGQIDARPSRTERRAEIDRRTGRLRTGRPAQ